MIKQYIEVLDEDEKKEKVIDVILKYGGGERVLIFCQTKKTCDFVYRLLEREKFPVNVIHGDKTQRVHAS
jgi:ATP-dependent RNA helicase DDX5/DBP2